MGERFDAAHPPTLLMRVRAAVSLVEGYPPMVWNIGEEFDLPDSDAMALLRAGHVERVASVYETAALNRGEKAVRQARPIR